ncbi:MAG: type I-C CRISPR-associated protein Cas8c/Csd1 [Sedimentisphaerales bacterium]|nr:type I-C CRISPR-associated protein Cas8c/Csd1 [Sedimentisphaerales bacterium]
MGFWQHLADSYDRNADALKKTYPLSTTSISNNTDMIAVIVIDNNGNFIRFEKMDKKSSGNKKGLGNPLVNITIPVTEESMGRSSGIAPHPVFDQYEYLKGSGKKFISYCTQLKEFAESSFATKQLMAISQYIAKQTVAVDLSENGLKDKTYIVFQVEIPGNPQSKVWEDETFFKAWHQYYLYVKNQRAYTKRMAKKELAENKKLPSPEKKRLKELAKMKDMISVDYITGVEQPTAIYHPKKISNASANSKLVSDNDKTNYTFRGKFSESSEAVSIGYETTQKAHQFLRYLINDQKIYCGEQIIISFTVGSMEKVLPPPIEEKSIWSILQESAPQTENDIQIRLRAETGFDYADALRKSLAGFGYKQTLGQHARTLVVVLDAATTGRLSITFYRELDRTEYLEKIANWHDRCKWHQKFWDKENEKYIPYTGAPSVDKIIEAVHGKARSRKDEGYTKIKKAARERLLRCIFDGALLPIDFMVSAVRRSSNPLGITKNGVFDRNNFEQVVSTACALIRKYYQQTGKEDYKMSIEFNRTDRDYLYGRLLGAADKLEEYALYKMGNKRIVTAAIRHMQAFAQRPFRTWQTIHSCLNPYIQKVKEGFAFNEIQAIKDMFKSGDYETDTPLNGSYLIGYYHERAYIDNLVTAASNKSINKSSHINEKENGNDGQ